jgi:uncharacterized protein
VPSFQDLAQKALGALGLGQGQTPSTPAAASQIPAPASSASDTGSSWIRFEAHGPQWGFAFWGLSEADLQSLSGQAGRVLSLRIADVTGLQPGQPPHALQELRVDPRAEQWGVALPLGNRIYRAELGLINGGSWRSLACANPTLIPGYDDSASAPAAFAPFTVVSEPIAAAPLPASAAAAPGLHERLYQSATVRIRRLGRGSETFHELEGLEDVGLALSDSGLGLWASGRNESGSGLVARQRSFWLVADAELIVYGATDPTATLRIGDEVVPLSADGSFRIQVPFRDGQQLYPIEAISADGEQRRSIVLQFERTTPEDHTNPASAAQAEWF